MISNNIVRIENCLFSYNNGTVKRRSGGTIIINGFLTCIFISDCIFYNNRNYVMIRQRANLICWVSSEKLFTNIFISSTSFSLNINRSIAHLKCTKLHLQGQVIFYNNTSTESLLRLQESISSFRNYTEFSANKYDANIKYDGKNYFYSMLTENSILNVSYNNFTNFAYTDNELPKIPMLFSLMEIIQLYLTITMRSILRMHIIIYQLFIVVG